MLAPAESAMSDSNNTSEENPRLEQPKDAAPMESRPQPSSAAIPVDKNAKTDVNTDEIDKKHATDPSPSTAGATTSLPAEQAAFVPPASPKGKEKETAPPPPSKETMQDPTMAIGPTVDDIKAASSGSTDSAPVCNLIFLLTSGSRHPYKINAKSLNRRNVAIPAENENGQPDPFSISIYTLKELVLREWRSDWGAKPASPSSIRLIHFGKLLDNKEQLKKYQFSTEGPNVVHMSIRPQNLDEEEPKSGTKNLGTGGSDGPRQRAGGCCVVL